MTDGYLMDADCIHGVEWYACIECERDNLRAELAALKARRCDGCAHWSDEFDSDIGFGWCAKYDAQVELDHSCAAWTEEPQ